LIAVASPEETRLKEEEEEEEEEEGLFIADAVNGEDPERDRILSPMQRDGTARLTKP
jgi:hypothetical protein